MSRLWTCCLRPHSPPKPLPQVKPPETRSDTGSDKIPGHLYIIKEREFIKTNENIYKIGKSTDIKSRMPKYPKNSCIYGIVYCSLDIHQAEKDLIQHFDKRFTQRSDIGREYYEVQDTVPVLIAEFVNVAIKHIN